jgi:hypothetical protein
MGTPNKRKALKECTKDRAHCYGHESERNVENGARVEKIQLSEDLYYKRNKRTIGFYLF